MRRLMLTLALLITPMTSGCIYGLARNYQVTVIPQKGMNSGLDRRVQVDLMWLRKSDLAEFPATFPAWIDHRQGANLADLFHTVIADPNTLERESFRDEKAGTTGPLRVPSQYGDEEFYGFRVFANYRDGTPDSVFTYEAGKSWFPDWFGSSVTVNVYLNRTTVGPAPESAAAPAPTPAESTEGK